MFEIGVRIGAVRLQWRKRGEEDDSEEDDVELGRVGSWVRYLSETGRMLTRFV